MVSKIVQEDIKNIVNSIKKEAGVFEGKTLLISGGAGFLGSYMVAAILKLNAETNTQKAKQGLSNIHAESSHSDPQKRTYSLSFDSSSVASETASDFSDAAIACAAAFSRICARTSFVRTFSLTWPVLPTRSRR